MIVYNLTIKVDWDVHESWLDWMQREHIPEVLATGCFVKHSILRILEIDDSDGPTYAVQFHGVNREIYNHYIITHAASLRGKTHERWGEKIATFRTLMEVLH